MPGGATAIRQPCRMAAGLLLHEATARLQSHGFRVLVHSRVACNDGGISLGQAVVAAAADRR